MSLIVCPDCGTKVSHSAKTCPSCGASAKAIARVQRAPAKQIGRFGKIVIGGAVLGAVAVAAVSIMHEPSPAMHTNTQADALFKQRGQAAMKDAVNLKQSLREPGSLTFDKILTNDDGSLVCISYRARNGFGGMDRDHVTFIAGLGTTSSAVWRKRCARVELNDETRRTVQLISVLAH